MIEDAPDRVEIVLKIVVRKRLDNVRVDAPLGTVHAFDARSGQPRWSFDPLIHDGISAGHANVWAPMSADDARGLVYLPTTSPSPDFFGGRRPGNNEHANSVVALKVETGELAWSFQTVHHDVWDYDLPAQPFPTHVPPLMEQSFSLQDEFHFPPIIGSPSCDEELKPLRNDGLYTPPSTQGTIIFPMTGGGVNWGSAAFDPINQILYANTTHAIHIVRLMPRALADDFEAPPGVDFGRQIGAPFAMTRRIALSKLGMPCNKPP